MKECPNPNDNPKCKGVVKNDKYNLCQVCSLKGRKHTKDSRRGKTWADIYGLEEAKKMREKHSKRISGSGNMNKNKSGKTYEQIYGVKRAKQLRDLHSKTKKGKSYDEIFSPERKLQITTKQRLAAIKQWKQKTENCWPNYNPSACRLFEQMMKKDGTFIQHAENGGEFYIKELGYWVDGYDKENNIVYEYDEKHHFNSAGQLRQKDAERQSQIEQSLKCKFIRITEDEE